MVVIKVKENGTLSILFPNLHLFLFYLHLFGISITILVLLIILNHVHMYIILFMSFIHTWYRYEFCLINQVGNTLIFNTLIVDILSVYSQLCPTVSQLVPFINIWRTSNYSPFIVSNSFCYILVVFRKVYIFVVTISCNIIFLILSTR